MVDEFCGKHCYRCGGTQYAEYTVFRDGAVMGKTYKACVVCRDCGQIVATVSDHDERRAMKLAKATREE